MTAELLRVNVISAIWQNKFPEAFTLLNVCARRNRDIDDEVSAKCAYRGLRQAVPETD